MIESFSDCDFLNWFPQHKEEFTPEIRNRLAWMYVTNAGYMKGARCNVLIYKQDLLYVGFQRFCISGKEINLDYTAVESNTQKNGIGLELASRAIDEGLSIDCSNVTSKVSNAARKLIAKLKQKYPLLTFNISYTGEP